VSQVLEGLEALGPINAQSIIHRIAVPCITLKRTSMNINKEINVIVRSLVRTWEIICLGCEYELPWLVELPAAL
jgi:hypothetical protein